MCMDEKHFFRKKKYFETFSQPAYEISWKLDQSETFICMKFTSEASPPFA